MVKNLPAMQETWVQSLGQEDTLEKRMATHSNILARRQELEWDMTEQLTVSLFFQKNYRNSFDLMDSLKMSVFKDTWFSF